MPAAAVVAVVLALVAGLSVANAVAMILYWRRSKRDYPVFPHEIAAAERRRARASQ